MHRVAIIGGGISGLAAAYALEKARAGGAALEYALYEASGRLGGVICSENTDGYLFDCGPDSFLTIKPEARRLCVELGLEGDLCGSNDAERRTYILVHRRLVAMPDGLQFLVPTNPVATAFTPLFSLGTKLRFIRDYMRKPAAPASEDESVASFVERHFGREVVDRLADPLLSGVYGGEADRMSVRAVLPGFVTLEEKYGSLVRGVLAGRNAPRSAGPLFTTLRGGLQQICERIVRRLQDRSLHLNTRINTLRRNGDRWELQVQGAWEPFDSLVLAVPANQAGGLLRSVDAALAEELQTIRYGSSAVVIFAYDANSGVAEKLPPGFGLLSPRTEGTRLRAVTFVHNKFPGRAQQGTALLRMFFGGTADQQVLDLSDEDFTALAQKELQQVLGLTAAPQLSRVYRWRNAMAQYDVGHLQKVARIQQRLATCSALYLAGNAYNGIGISDCIRSGEQSAASILKTLQPEMARS